MKGPDRVRKALAEAGLGAEVRDLDASTRTAAEAAAALGCEPEQIASSLAFRGPDGPLVVIASGGRRVDERRLAELVGGEVALAAADEVRAWTGYAIGGVPPLGHARELPKLFDAALLRWPLVWAAAGSPRAVFAAEPNELARAIGAQVAHLTRRTSQRPR